MSEPEPSPILPPLAPLPLPPTAGPVRQGVVRDAQGEIVQVVTIFSDTADADIQQQAIPGFVVIPAEEIVEMADSIADSTQPTQRRERWRIRRRPETPIPAPLPPDPNAAPPQTTPAPPA